MDSKSMKNDQACVELKWKWNFWWFFGEHLVKKLRALIKGSSFEQLCWNLTKGKSDFTLQEN